MNDKRLSWFVLAGVVLAVAWASRFGSANQPHPEGGKWEFSVTHVNVEQRTVVTQSVQDQLKGDSAEGWELVSLVPVERNGTTMYIVMTMKRPKD